MSVTVLNVLTTAPMKLARVAAGKLGLNNVISCIDFFMGTEELKQLKPNALLLFPSLSICENELSDMIIPELASKSVSMICFKTIHTDDELPKALLMQADHYGIPVVLVPSGITYSEIISYVSLLMDQTAIEKQYDISSIFLRIIEQGGDLSSTAEILAKELHLPVLLEDNSFRILAYCINPELLNGIPADNCLLKNRLLKKKLYSEYLTKHSQFELVSFPFEEESGYGFTVIPLRFRNQILGNITLIHFSPLSEQQKTALKSAAVFTSVLLYEKQSSSEKESVIRDGILLDLIHGTYYTNENIQYWLNYFHYEDTARYIVFILHAPSDDTRKSEFSPLADSLQSILLRPGLQKMLKKAYWLTEGNQIVVIMPLQSPALVNYRYREDYYEDFCQALEQEECLKYYLADGGITDSIYSLKKAYDRAVVALTIGIQLYKPGCVCLYENLYLYNLLNHFGNSQEIKEFSDLFLSPLMEDDVHFNALETLEVYLSNNHSMEKTAKALFLHKNTLKYRIGKIKELLNNDLSDSNYTLSLRIALMIRRLYL